MHLGKFIVTNTVINAEAAKDTMFFNFLLTLWKHIFIIQNLKSIINANVWRGEASDRKNIETTDSADYTEKRYQYSVPSVVTYKNLTHPRFYEDKFVKIN